MLTPKIELVSLSKDGKTITLKDSTGAYHATNNPGGYGTPNPDYSSYFGLVWRYWTATAAAVNKILTGAATTALHTTAGYGLTPLILGIGTDEESFEDGVHHVKYYPFEEIAATTLAATNGSKTVTRASGAVDLTTIFDSTNYKYVAFVSAATPQGVDIQIYEIDFTSTFSATEITLKDAYDGTTQAGATGLRSLEADLKVLVYSGADKCVSEGIGKLSEESECCMDDDKLTRLLEWRFGSEVKFDCKDYDGAHDMIVHAKSKCDDYCQSCN